MQKESTLVFLWMGCIIGYGTDDADQKPVLHRQSLAIAEATQLICLAIKIGTTKLRVMRAKPDLNVIQSSKTILDAFASVAHENSSKQLFAAF